MAESPRYRELLQLLNEFEVEYLIVGGFAVMKYGEPRYTKDMKESGVAPLLQKTFIKMDMALATSAPFETGGRE